MQCSAVVWVHLRTANGQQEGLYEHYFLSIIIEIMTVSVSVLILCCDWLLMSCFVCDSSSVLCEGLI